MTEHIPTRDTMTIKSRSGLTGATVIGPDCYGISVLDAGKPVIMPVSVFGPGGAPIANVPAEIAYLLRERVG